jgi:hypothetical protein
MRFPRLALAFLPDIMTLRQSRTEDFAGYNATVAGRFVVPNDYFVRSALLPCLSGSLHDASGTMHCVPGKL